MSDVSTATEKILNASLILFARYGFDRTKMADIAREAGIARATLYLHFPDRSAVFEAMAAALVARALERAQSAWRDGASLADNLEAMILAKDLEFFRLMRTTPHGEALLAVDAELTRRHVERLDKGLKALFAQQARSLIKQGCALDAFGGAAGFSGFLTIASAGLKHEAQTEKDYRGAVRQLARVVAAALKAPRSRS